MIIGVAAEKIGESSFICFTRLFNFMFGTNSGGQNVPNMQNVEIASDRGYMTIGLVFAYLITAGADLIGTVKRALSWPFTYDQKLGANDKHTKVESKGAPALFVKTVNESAKMVTASSFRNGSDSVSNTISTIHRGHHWEGIALNENHHQEYENDNTSMHRYTFNRDVCFSDVSQAEKEIIDQLKAKVDPITIAQGSADWHMGRNFSLTSSQCHGTFKKAFPLFASNESWKIVAKHLYGPSWMNHLVCETIEDQELGDETIVEGKMKSPSIDFFNYMFTHSSCHFMTHFFGA